MLDRKASPKLANSAIGSGLLTALCVAFCTCASVFAAPMRQAAPRPATPAPPPAAKSAYPWKQIGVGTEPRNGKIEGPKMLNSGEVTDPKLFDDYWTYMVSQLTWEENETDLFKVRNSLKTFMRRGKDPARERLVKTVILPFCTKVAKGKEFSPAARYNAVLTIGELNKVDFISGGPPQVSLPEARATLLEFLDPSLPVDDMHDALRVAAMVGLQNHVERGGISDDRQKKTALTALQAMLKSKDPPPGRSADVHKWILGLATQLSTGLNGGRVATGR